MFGIMKRGIGMMAVSHLKQLNQTQIQAQFTHHSQQRTGLSTTELSQEHLRLRNDNTYRRLMNFLAISILCLAFTSCSPRKQDNNALPVYSDMGAAHDLGTTKP